jgi:hypothetical protein
MVPLRKPELNAFDEFGGPIVRRTAAVCGAGGVGKKTAVRFDLGVRDLVDQTYFVNF